MGLPAPEVATSAGQLELPDTVIPAKSNRNFERTLSFGVELLSGLIKEFIVFES